MSQRKTIAGIVAFLSVSHTFAQAPDGKESYLGSLAPILGSVQRERGFPLAYENRKGMSVDQWRRRARAEVERELSYAPRSVPLDLQVHRRIPARGYELRIISFAGSPHYRIPAFLLVPTSGKPPFPAVVALHDHGGYFLHGKEKLVEFEDEHPALTTFKNQYYGGRSWASELARRGFVVLAIDAFYWGERRIQYRVPPPDFVKRMAGLEPSTVEYVRALNSYLRERVYELNTWASYAGTSWMGIVAHDDRRSVDLLASLPEVDRLRIGCAGLSGGGFRATYLTGLEPRIRASIIVGWMTSLPTTLDIGYSTHAGMLDAFGLHANLDHPDVATLGAPDAAVFVQNCGRDRLFTRAGMEQAGSRIQRVYEDLNRPERFFVKSYDVPHQFDANMQQEAFDWLEKWLAPGKR